MPPSLLHRLSSRASSCPTLLPRRQLLAWALGAGAAALLAPGPAPRAQPAEADKPVVRTAELPARGLFEGDRLSAAAQRQLAQLVAGADDLDIEVAFVAPSGAWVADGQGERSLTPARLQSVRDFLASRGVPGRRVYVESRIDPKARDATLVVQIVGKRGAP